MQSSNSNPIEEVKGNDNTLAKQTKVDDDTKLLADAFKEESRDENSLGGTNKDQIISIPKTSDPPHVQEQPVDEE